MWSNTMARETILVSIDKGLVELLDKLVEAGLFKTRSEAIREGARELVIKYFLRFRSLEELREFLTLRVRDKSAEVVMREVEEEEEHV